ncbi:hypothetical protein AARAC_001055 [Aspergillus arachidicola]|uniref:Glucose-methanol-choline oxidoreductase N-terminal domain-containing protein n=1 Tax=Aspergillus arachidicola TaxID=656916 RepID=A0A2G7G6U5_9EURO|nr:hypothetical protein AARAC_001055 [Aspergillus arachidicola]
MLINRLIDALTFSAILESAIDLKEYEYVTLLLEAGNDQGHNLKYSVPGYAPTASEDPALAWNFYVRYYADEAHQARDFRTMNGILYPRAGTLGGCTAHNALVAIYPYRSDFDYIAGLTGDSWWRAENVREYFVRWEKNGYLPPGKRGHGYNGWLGIETPPLRLVLQDTRLLSLVLGGAFALNNESDPLTNIASLIAGDANVDNEARDTTPAYYALPFSVNDAKHNGLRELIVSVHDAVNEDGSKKYPLDVRMDCFVTEIIFDTSVSPPHATGVEILDGEYLYKASPLSMKGKSGIPGTATASREVIVAGGIYNSPQLLKLSGIGP